MRVAIVREDNIVVVDGVARTVDLSDLVDPAIHAIQWNEDVGEVEYVIPGTGNSEFSDPLVIEDIVAAWEAAAPTPPESAPPGVDDVVAERERRLAAGFDFDFGAPRGEHRIGTTAQDMVGWRDVTDLANALITSGQPDTANQIVTDTGPVTVTAAEWTTVLLAAAAFRQPIWGASFLLQAMDPIPDEFADDAYWP